jgi:hypothetical protein
MNPVRNAFQAPIVQPVAPPQSSAPIGGGGFVAGAAGNKVYGNGAVTAPTRGPVTNTQGYQQRDAMAAARRNALINRVQNGQVSI